MYAPAQFREERRDVLVAAMRDIQLAAIVSAADGDFVATHVPVVVREDGARLLLETHVSRQNDHWKRAGTRALAIFQGPQAYVHPGWYESKRQHGKVVPTWTYVMIHARGMLECFDGEAELIEHVSRLTNRNEALREQPWAVSDAPERYIQTMIRGIVGLRLLVETLDGSWKLNQHKSDEDRAGVMDGLGQEADETARKVSELMRARETERAPAGKE